MASEFNPFSGRVHFPKVPSLVLGNVLGTRTHTLDFSCASSAIIRWRDSGSLKTMTITVSLVSTVIFSSGVLFPTLIGAMYCSFQRFSIGIHGSFAGSSLCVSTLVSIPSFVLGWEGCPPPSEAGALVYKNLCF